MTLVRDIVIKKLRKKYKMSNIRNITINEKNFDRIVKLYGEVYKCKDLERIINNHISVVLDEIEDDITKSKK